MLIITICSLFLRTFQYINFYLLWAVNIMDFLSYLQKKPLTAQQYKIIWIWLLFNESN